MQPGDGKLCCIVAKSCLTILCLHGPQPIRLLCSWAFPGKKTRVGCHFLLQGIFLIQVLNLHLLHCQVNFFFPLSHQGSHGKLYQQGKIYSGNSRFLIRNHGDQNEVSITIFFFQVLKIELSTRILYLVKIIL